MKKIIVIILILIGACVFYFRLYDLDRVRGFLSSKGINIQKPSEMISDLNKSIKEKVSVAAPPKDAVTVYLKNKSYISGILVKETENEVIIKWNEGDVEFKKDEIEKIDYGKIKEAKKGNLFEEKKDSTWDYNNDIAVKLKTGIVIDSVISSASKDMVLIKNELDGGGAIEQEIKRENIEALLFKPIENKASLGLKENLQLQFPKMSFYDEGFFTIVTDSNYSWVEQYKKVLREHCTEFYLDYFDLLKNSACKVQNFVVIFDYWPDFVNYAISDGVPGWAVAGYFSPRTGVLYSFNALGDRFSEFMYEAVVGNVSNKIDERAKQIEGKIDRRYEIFVEGQADEVKKKFQHYHSILRGLYRDETFSTIRHEATHQLFYNWGVQNVAISKIKAEDKDKIKKKKEFIETNDISKKRKALMELANLRRSEDDIKFDASSSWFVEGMATYSETEPIGELNKRWLYSYQDAYRKKSLMPIEYLTVFKMGSFPGISSNAMYDAYAESWALTYFLMNKHREQFMEYLDKIRIGKYSDNENLALFLECMKLDLRTLEKEFTDYMSGFEALEDPDLEMFDTVERIFSN